jgi:hypothetical protein
VLQLLEHHDSRALSLDEAVPVLSNGRLACAGSSFRVDSAFIAANPPMPSGVIAASEPPAIIASVSPMRIDFTASPMAWAEVEQADTGDQFGPLHPYLMVTRPGGHVDDHLEDEERARAVEALLQRLLVLLLQRAQPPMPEPMMTPTFSGT